VTPATQLAGIIERTHALLIDFDGPICSIFAGYPAHTLADDLRQLVAALGGRVPTEPDAEEDPIHVLRLVAITCPPPIVRAVADALRDAELKATETAEPTPAADDVLRAAQVGGRHVAVVSNNSEDAVRRYLDRHELGSYVDHVSARYDGMHPGLMKPNDHLIRRALDSLGAAPRAGTLIGDSISDVDAGRSAGLPVIGYANKPGKQERLNDAGADAVIDSMTELADAIRTARPVR